MPNQMKLLDVIIIFIVLLFAKSFSKVENVTDVEKIEFCSRLNCRDGDVGKVCGLRAEGEGFRLKLFENECELFKYGCNVDEAHAYGLINTEYCEKFFALDYNETKQNYKSYDDYIKNNNETTEIKNVILKLNTAKPCGIITCDHTEEKEVCGIRKDGVGFRIRLFRNLCELTKHNCENGLEFTVSDLFICKFDIKNGIDEIKNSIPVTKNLLTKNSFELSKSTDDKLKEANQTNDKDKSEVHKEESVKKLVVVNSKIFGQYDNINDSIDTFFAASHVLDLPLKEVSLNTRRKWLKYAGPVQVFVPWISKPANISNGTLYRPTLSSCYHKCPFKCPDTYAPVCGVPGVVAREPSLMFQNHCFMDVAQCKMFWENKSSTSHSSSYVESSFLFCMGDEMNAVYRFMPAIRTLQHMGRLKKKGKFRAILRNFRFVSEFRYGRPKFMGRK